MPIGKSSITKRVAKQTEETVVEKVTPPTTEKNIAPELVATTGVAPAKKTVAKKPATATAKKPATTAKTGTATKTAAQKKPAQKKPAAPKAASTTVLSNVAPETVEAVIGHKENAKVDKIQIGGKLPAHLL